jgi:peptidoglycan/xylan/chitin deacetylase (PgdA/CDA1 family)
MGLPLLAGLGLLSLGVLIAAAYHRNCSLYGRVISKGPANQKSLYLTFDDGPNPSATESILQTLDASKTPAAFFMVGRSVERFPALARKVGEAGHDIGNHTYDHTKLHLKGARFIRSNLKRSHETIAEATGRPPRFFRAPHGLRNPFVTVSARQRGYALFGWTFGVWDSDRPGVEHIRRRVHGRLKAGAIILLHDGDGRDPEGDRSQTAQALPGIIADAREAGYEFRPLRELLVK